MSAGPTRQPSRPATSLFKFCGTRRLMRLCLAARAIMEARLVLVSNRGELLDHRPEGLDNQKQPRSRVADKPAWRTSLVNHLLRRSNYPDAGNPHFSVFAASCLSFGRSSFGAVFGLTEWMCDPNMGWTAGVEGPPGNHQLQQAGHRTPRIIFDSANIND